jgi:capsid protein
LFAMLRRYTLAVVAAAETAASFAGIIYTDSPADESGYDVDPLDTFEVVRNMFTSMPAGWKLNQLEAEQPTSTYGEFRDKLLNEISRCLIVPLNVALGDSSNYNYASGRLDHQVYHRNIYVDRNDISLTALDQRIWRQWIDEASLIDGYLPAELRQIDADLVPHEWYWDGFEHVDPDKESKGEERNLRTGRLTIPDLHAKNGKDWEQQQVKQAAALGLSVEEYRRRLADYLLGPVAPEPVEQEEGEEVEED